MLLDVTDPALGPEAAVKLLRTVLDAVSITETLPLYRLGT